ncbi:hypothetical protein Ahy_A03g014129 isoform B [Arachis hypogaea]|uniref:Protein FAR1-RELATED SEQUENCE n=1 Tax=Arachis hypogaea TaxID=3818 RepID=A0A445DX44_ARAHY|nr:hypothetical protein Ahy_A03g014129 isoform B [Arachis hypogaea]
MQLITCMYVMQGVSGLEFARVIQHMEKIEHSTEGNEGKRAKKYISNSNRKREHKVLTRAGCEAMLAVYFDTKTSTWRVKKLVEKYNHDLASAYLKDKFCAEFRTTSRCEAINNFIKMFICIRQSLLELVQNLEHALRNYRHNELTVYGKPVPTTGLEALELCVINFYTREIIGEVKMEIQGVITLDIINEKNISTTVVLKVKECDRSRWSSEGISCNHIFCAMKRVGLQKFSDRLLLKRWSKDVRKYLKESSTRGTAQDKERAFLMRYSALSVATT